MRSHPRRLWLALLLGASVASAGACKGTEFAGGEPIGANEVWPAGLPKPADIAEAQAQRARGVVWTDRQVRQFYLERVATIGEGDRVLQAAGKGMEERALAAYEARRVARLTARAMMQDAAAVEALRARDRDKYGAPEGPSFTYLVERAQAKGLSGDAVYQSIIDSAQRTDAATNSSMGL